MAGVPKHSLNKRFALVLLIGVSGPALSAMYQSPVNQCNGDTECVRSKVKSLAIERAESYYPLDKDKPNGEQLLIKDACYSSGGYRFKDQSTVYPESQCSTDVGALYREAVDAERAEKELREQRVSLQQESERQSKEIEKQKEQSLEADLRAGRVRPANIRQAVIAYNAESGYDIAKSPKIRPDGKLYALVGKIAIADEKPEFVAHISYGQDSDQVAKALNRSGEMATTYFRVKVPKGLQDHYFDNARIGRGFDVVGRYASNFKYKTVSGQELTAPVFEAQYFVFW